jgi:hypothetical protein
MLIKIIVSPSRSPQGEGWSQELSIPKIIINFLFLLLFAFHKHYNIIRAKSRLPLNAVRGQDLFRVPALCNYS